jgi:hypothetical protein
LFGVAKIGKRKIPIIEKTRHPIRATKVIIVKFT